jgi:hypothetical protein
LPTIGPGGFGWACAASIATMMVATMAENPNKRVTVVPPSSSSKLNDSKSGVPSVAPRRNRLGTAQVATRQLLLGAAMLERHAE